MNAEVGRAVRRAVDVYREVYGDALRDVYVSGSVHRDEAVFGISDLDTYAWVGERLRETEVSRHHPVVVL